MKKGFYNIIINYFRRIVDRYDTSYNLKEKKVFDCKNPETRNRYKRDEFVIPLDQPQCPIYKDNRCCGCCDYAPTCDYAVNCNCYGFAYACLGGTDEGAYMREKDYSEYGRINEDGKFDWDYYEFNKKSKLLQIGVFGDISSYEKLGSEDISHFMKSNNIKYLKVIGDISSDGYVDVDCSVYGIDKVFNINVDALYSRAINEETVKNYIARRVHQEIQRL